MDQDRDGVPLAHYVGHGAGVRFSCNGCQASHDVLAIKVVARLQARGLGGPETGVRAVARLSDRPCPRCGARRWETRPAFNLGGR